VAYAFKCELRQRLRTLAAQAGAREPELLGDALMLLMEGGQMTRLTFACEGPVYAAMAAVRCLLDAHCGADPNPDPDSQSKCPSSSASGN